MKSASLTWVLGAVTAFGLGMSAQACSSSSTSATPDGGGTSSSTGSSHSKSTASTGSTGTTGNSSPSGSSSTGSTESSGKSSNGCYYGPDHTPFPEDGGALYCPYSETTDGGKAQYCTPPTEHCCEPASGTAACTPTGTACGTGDTDWTCEGTPDCASMAGTICCGDGTLDMQAAQPGCAADGGTLGPYEYADKFTGSHCVAPTACTGSANFQICSKDSECPSGSCQSVKPKGANIGYCVGSGTGSSSGSSSTGASSSSGGSTSSSHASSSASSSHSASSSSSG